MNNRYAFGVQHRDKSILTRSTGLLIILSIVAFFLMMMFGYLFQPTVAYAQACGLTGTVTGVVFRDHNNNGIQDAGEPIIENVTVSAYTDSNTPVESCETLDDGTYALAITGGTDIRLEFTLPADGSLDYLSPAPIGSGNLSSVQFVSVPATGSITQNAAFHDPYEYCQSNPTIGLSCTRYGELGDPATPQDAIIGFSYDVPAPNVVIDTSTELLNGSTLSQFDDIGSVYGLAYNGSDGSLFASAWVKRHVALGPNGLGAIYRIDTASNTTALHVDLNALVPNQVGVGPDRTSIEAPVLFHDPDAFAKVGTTGIGDIEMSPDDQTLFAVNMASRELIALPTDPNITLTVNDLDTFSIPNSCSNASDARPMGLGYNNGDLYVGVVCSAQSIADSLPVTVTNNITFVQSADFDTFFADEFKANVFSFDLATQTFDATPVLTVPLNYNRGCIYFGGQFPTDNLSGCLDDNLSWRPWQSDWEEVYSANSSGDITNGAANNPIEYPQPLLSDIEFDGEDMILGFRDLNGDRTGFEFGVPSLTASAAGFLQDQTFTGNGLGDILRACVDANGNYVLENNATCGAVTTIGADNGQGPGTIISGGPATLVGSGEYYWNDQGPGGANTAAYNDNGSDPFASRNAVHDQTAMGGLVQVTGEDEVLSTMVEVTNYYNAGLGWFDNGTGATTKRHGVYSSTLDVPPGVNFPVNANGLGDLEAFCNAAPIEIGNFVWEDTDSDGIQDPGEPALANVTVELLGSASIATAVTDANGYYVFSNDAVRTSTASAIYGLDIRPQTSYTVRIEFVNQAPLNGLTVTAGNALSGNNSDLRDSDGLLDGDYSRVTINTGTTGENNHTVDFGFTTQLVADRGDLPDSYGTTISVNGAAHRLVDETRLGTCVDSDIDGWPSSRADGDDTEDTGALDGSGTCVTAGDDEDGTFFDTVLNDDSFGVICTTFDMQVLGNVPVGAADGVLNLWVDFNADGDFDTNEQVVTDNVVDGTLAVADTLIFSAPTAGSFLPLLTVRQINDIYIPCDNALVGDRMGIRLRFTAGAGQGGENPTGVAQNGEVEDYVLDIVGWDFGDAPECTQIPSYACNQTTIGSLTDYFNNVSQQQEGARHILVEGGPRLGSTVDNEATGAPAIQINVNTGGDGGDETGFLGVLSTGGGFESWSFGNGGSIRVEVDSVDPTNGACVYGFLDWDQDGFAVGSNNGEASAYTTTDGTVLLSFNDPGIFDGQDPNKEVYLRLRIVPGNGIEADCARSLYDFSGAGPGLNPGPIGAAVGGEVEDYYLQFTPTSVTIREFNVVDSRMNTLILVVLFGLALSTMGWMNFNRRNRIG